MTPLLLFIFAILFVSFCLYMMNRTQAFFYMKKQYHCDVCSFPLAREDLIPLYSWMTLRGSCRYCQSLISYKYLIWELLGLTFFISAIFVLGFFTAFLLMFLTIIAMTDLNTDRIPTLWVVLAGLLALPEIQSINLFLLIAFCVVGYLIRQMFEKPPLGKGDIKFLAMSGLWLSPTQIPLFLIITGVGGILTALILKRRLVPLGPALCVALGMSVVLGEKFDLVQHVIRLVPILP